MRIVNKALLNISLIKSYLIYCLAITIPINQKLSTFFLILTGIVSIFGLRKKDFFSLFKISAPLFFLYFLYTISYARDGIEFQIFEKKAALLVFPVVFFGTHPTILKRALRLFVYGCIINYFICLIAALTTSIDGFGIDFVNPVSGKEFGFIESIDHSANKILGSAFIITDFQRSYLAMYFAFALGIVWLSFKKEGILLRVMLSLFLCFGIIQTWSLAGILSLVLIIVYLIFTIVKNNFLKGSFLVIVILAVTGIVTLNNRASFMYRTIVTGNMNLQGPTASTIRLRTWVGSIDRIKKRPITGYGMKNSQIALNKFYSEQIQNDSRFSWPLKESFNSHNQYLQFLLESGIIGLLFFIFTIIYFIFKLSTYTLNIKLLGFAFIILILMNFLFESMMNRYMGISFFAFCYSLFISFGTGGSRKGFQTSN